MFYLMALKGILLSFFCQTLNDFSCSISECVVISDGCKKVFKGSLYEHH